MVWNIVFLSSILTFEGKKDCGQMLYPIEVYFAILPS